MQGQGSDLQPPLFVEAMFVNKATGEIKEQEVFMGDFPMMTERGTFIINGTGGWSSPSSSARRRLLQPRARQDHRPRHLRREDHPLARRLARVRRRQGHGRRPHRPQAPAERHGPAQGARMVRDEILALFDNATSIQNTLEKDHVTTPEEALEDIYRKLRPGSRPRPSRRARSWRTCSSTTSSTTTSRGWAATR